MRSIWKGTISFGLVNIPIALGIATQRSDPSSARSTPRRCSRSSSSCTRPAATRRLARRDDQGLRGRQGPVRPDHRRGTRVGGRGAPAHDRHLAFIDMDEVDPVYYDRTYYVDPQEAAKKPYALLLEAMKESGKAAVGKFVLVEQGAPRAAAAVGRLARDGDPLLPRGRALRRTRSRRRCTARRSRSRARDGEAADRVLYHARSSRPSTRTSTSATCGADRGEGGRRGDPAGARARGAAGRAGPDGGTEGVARAGADGEARSQKTAAAKKKGGGEGRPAEEEARARQERRPAAWTRADRSARGRLALPAAFPARSRTAAAATDLGAERPRPNANVRQLARHSRTAVKSVVAHGRSRQSGLEPTHRQNVRVGRPGGRPRADPGGPVIRFDADST